MKRDIVDRLYSKAIKRYRKEHPERIEKDFSNEFASAIWYSIKGVLDREGEEAAEKYVEEGKLW